MIDLEKWMVILRKDLHRIIGDELKQGSIDLFTEEYDEPKQLWTIDLSFNLGDIRTLRIKLDINPDE